MSAPSHRRALPVDRRAAKDEGARNPSLRRAKGIRRIEKDPFGGWIARRTDGSAIYDEDWRWNTRSSAWSAAYESDWLLDAPTLTPES